MARQLLSPALLGLLTMTLACQACATASTPDPIADEQAIIASVNDFWQGWEVGDRDQVQRNLAAAYVDIDVDGVRREAADVLAFVEPAEAEQSVAITVSDHRVVFLSGTAAQVNYRVEDCRGAAAVRACFRFIASDTFVREAGSWKLAAGHQITQPAGAPDQAEAAKADVAAAVLAIARAQTANDPDAFTRLHTEDWRLTYGPGLIVDRDGFAADMRAFWKPTAVDYSEQTIRLARDSAIVEGVVTFHWQTEEGAERQSIERHVDVFVRQYGRWRRSASTLSCISGDCG
jgi:uncharacterized protein (TIGR02246 family)